MIAALKPSLPKTASQELHHINPTPQMLHNNSTPWATRPRRCSTIAHCKSALARGKPSSHRPAPCWDLPSLEGQAEGSLQVWGSMEVSTLSQQSPADTRGWGSVGRAHTRPSHKAPGPQLQRRSSYTYA